MIWNKAGNKYFLYSMILLHIAIGALVNPIRSGIDSIEEIALLQRLQEIEDENPKANWIIDNGLYADLGLMVGLDTINSTNVYPDIDRWKKIDIIGSNEDTYNRYAHIVAHTAAEETDFVYIKPDVFEVYLTDDDLTTLDVDYVLTTEERKQYDEIDRVGNYYIYCVQIKK